MGVEYRRTRSAFWQIKRKDVKKMVGRDLKSKLFLLLDGFSPKLNQFVEDQSTTDYLSFLIRAIGVYVQFDKTKSKSELVFDPFSQITKKPVRLWSRKTKRFLRRLGFKVKKKKVEGKVVLTW